MNPTLARKVEVIFWNEDPYQASPKLWDLGAAVAVAALEVPPPGPSSPSSAGTAAPSSLSTAESDAVVEDLRARLGRVSNKSHALAQKILQGAALAKPGERDQTLQRAASIVGWMRPDAPPEVVAEVLRPALDAMAEEDNNPVNPPPGFDDAVEKVVRAQADRRIALEQEQAENDSAMRGLMRAARASSAPTDAPVHDGPYTADELDGFCRELGCTRAELERRWVVQKGKAYYALVNGHYKLLESTELEVGLRQYLAPAPIEFDTVTSSGGLRRKTPKELLGGMNGKDGICTVAESLVAVMGEESRYEAVTGTFFEGVCQLRPIKPQFNQAVEDWLRIFAGRDTDRLLDYLACAPVLDRQICGLYLLGPKSTGKSMLALALARLYSDTWAPLSRILGGGFNDELTRCPVVVADEGFPSVWRGKQTSVELRELVGSSSRTLSRKFLPTCSLIGCLRIVLCANNDRMLNLNEDLDRADYEALEQRFFVLPAAKAAADHLHALGGLAHTADWIDGDVLPAHIAWLAATRPVNKGSRFLVEGRVGELKGMLATQSRMGSLCLEWLCKYFERPAANIQQAAYVVAGGGRLLVSTQGLADFWDAYIRSDKPERIQTIGRALGAFSEEKTRYAGRTYHVVDPEVVYWWSEKFDVGDPEAIRAAVEGSLEVQP